MYTIPLLLVITLSNLNPTDMRIQTGLASVYWPGDGHSGKVCADGKPFTPQRCHIAHRTWPLGRAVRVCSLTTGRCTTSYIGDRGPFGACDKKGQKKGSYICRGRWLIKIRHKDPGTWRGIADLSRCVWRKIGGPGMQKVTITLLRRKKRVKR